MKWYPCPFLLVCLLVWSCPASGKIVFEDVSEQAGIVKASPTAGAAWGDFNGDGWPDLWVTNHYLFPSLYLNKQDGTFEDVASRVLQGYSEADFHGPAWADFDNDGDQDLLVLTGGGGGRGECQNYLFVNEGEVLRDKAKDLGLDYPLGRGRTPLWFDADKDGRLDVLVNNKTAPGKTPRAPTALFKQGSEGFEICRHDYGFHNRNLSRFEILKAYAHNALHFRFQRPGSIRTGEVFAQLGDMSGDGHVDLVAYSNPLRVYSIQAEPFKDITSRFGFQDLISVQDVALADLNNDLKPDMYLARSNPWASSAVLVDPLTIRGALSGTHNKKRGFQFQSEGTVTFSFYPPWLDPSDPLKHSRPEILLGSEGVPATEEPIVLSPEDKAVQGAETPKTTNQGEISISYNATTGLWTVLCARSYIDFIVRSEHSIERLQLLGFKPSGSSRADVVLLSQDEALIRGKVFSSPAINASRSIAAGDFDNDMDIDVYLVCSRPPGNVPNVLYENDGSGRFSKVPDAGGAEGSGAGRGESVVMADYDGDGFLDLFVTNGGGFEPVAAEGPHQLFRNKGNDNHWLQLDLQGTRSNRDGIGARVVLEAGGVKQVRTQGGGMHYMAQHHQRLHFGLGEHDTVEEVVITWPSGNVQKVENVQADRIVVVVETEE